MVPDKRFTPQETRKDAVMDAPGLRPDDPPALLRPEEAGHLLSIGRSKIYQLMAAGEIPTVRIGKSVRVPRAGLLAWVERNTRLRSTDDASV